MNFLTCMFETLGGWFAGATWFQAVKWPFWFCLILVALGGVYTACFQKNTLLCRGITGALKLAMVYMFCIGFRCVFPACMEFLPNLPFISLSDETLTLIHPMSLFSHPLTELPQHMVKLFFLLFLINIGSHLEYSGRNKLSWCGSQIITCSISTAAYLLLAEGLNLGFELLSGKISGIVNIVYISAFIVFLLPLTILLTLKLIYIVFRKSGSPTYSKVMQFLSSQHYGSLYFVTFFSMLFTLVFLVAINVWDMAELTIAAFNPFAYILIMFICGVTLLVYSMYYMEHKFN